MNRRTLALLLFLPGCSSGLGQFCLADADCKAPLRCSATTGKRGVCTFADGVPDLATEPDLVQLDLTPSDVGDLTLDQGIDQTQQPDQTLPDRGPDGPVVDQTVPDQTVPDQMVPDQTTVTPDQGLDL